MGVFFKAGRHIVFLSSPPGGFEALERHQRSDFPVGKG